MLMNRPKLKRDWVGLTVKSLTPLRNGRYIIPAGTWFKVERNHNGLHLWSLGCHSCGIRVFINHVSERAVEIMPEKC